MTNAELDEWARLEISSLVLQREEIEAKLEHYQNLSDRLLFKIQAFEKERGSIAHSN